MNYSDPFGLCGQKGEAPCTHVYTLTVGAAFAYFVGWNGNAGVAVSAEGMRLFANSGASFGLGATLTKVQLSREEGTLENYGDKHNTPGFSGAGSPSVSTPFFSAAQIRSEVTDKNGQPTTRATGEAAGVGPGAGAFWNYTDDQVSTHIVPWASAPTPMSYTCAKTGVGCSTSAPATTTSSPPH